MNLWEMMRSPNELIEREKRRGPRTEPWKTLKVTGRDLDQDPGKETQKEWLDRWEENQEGVYHGNLEGRVSRKRG